MTPIGRLAARLWALPATLLGAALVLPLVVLGGRVAWVGGVVEVTAPAWLGRRRRTLPFDAITFGHLVFARSAGAHEALRAHERVHVRQFEAWGALFLVAYPLESVHQWLRGRCPYRANRFEVQARRLSEGPRDGQRLRTGLPSPP